MRRTAMAMRIMLAFGGLCAATAGAAAQDDGGGGGLLPGTSGIQKPAGGAVETCSARNALATKQCTTSCQPGQTAECADADGGSDPTCTCSGG